MIPRESRLFVSLIWFALICWFALIYFWPLAVLLPFILGALAEVFERPPTSEELVARYAEEARQYPDSFVGRVMRSTREWKEREAQSVDVDRP